MILVFSEDDEIASEILEKSREIGNKELGAVCFRRCVEGGCIAAVADEVFSIQPPY